VVVAGHIRFLLLVFPTGVCIWPLHSCLQNNDERATVSLENFRRQKKQLPSCSSGWRMPRRSLIWRQRVRGCLYVVSNFMLYLHFCDMTAQGLQKICPV